MKLNKGTKIQHIIDGSVGEIVEWNPALLKDSGYTYNEEYKWCTHCDSSTDGYVTVVFQNGCGEEIVPTRFLRVLKES